MASLKQKKIIKENTIDKHMQKTKKKSYYFGILAEYYAIIYLILKGYKFIERRHRNYFGEIDLIMKKKDIIAIIEVKARRKLNTIDELLTINQQKRIVNSTENFIAKNKSYQQLGIRFDLLLIRPLRLPLHLKGFWE
jgi:putative endonuclease